MKIIFKTKTFLLISVLLLATFSMFAQTAKSDFNGNWTLNESKSQPGDGPGRRAASKLVITQDDNTLTIERTSTRQSGETVVTKEVYRLDGSESDNSTENRKRKSVAKWSDNGQELTINSTNTFQRNGESFEMKSTEVYKLSADKQTLTVDNTMSSQRGDFKTTLAYDLKK